MSPRTQVVTDFAELERDFRDATRDMDRQVESILRLTGARTVELLKSYVGRTPDGRPEHPGGWGDITGRLAASYDFEVRRQGTTWQLSIINHDARAHLIEAIDGVFVVRGVAEAGGPADRAFHQAVAELAPDWRTV